jgi:hypothetical protein
MESQLQQQEYANTTSAEGMTASEPAPLAKLPPAPQTEEQWRQVGTQVSAFLAELPDYIGRFFNEYKQPITTIALLVAAIITVKVVLAVLDALNDIPLLAPTFELIGIGYSAWFINRYLLKASKRQELAGEIETLKQQVVGSQELSES